jgi:hypothetical protein
VLATPIGLQIDMSILKSPILNAGRLSDGRYKFSFATDTGTLFCEISATKSKDKVDVRSDSQKRSDALDRLRRLVKELDWVLADLA